MREQTLNGLESLKHSEHFPAVEAALTEQLEGYKLELESAPGTTFLKVQGKIAAIRDLQKVFEDLALLREQWSKQDNSNENPVIR